MKALLLILLFICNLHSFHGTKKNEPKDDSTLESTLNAIEDKLNIVYHGLNDSTKYIDELLTDQKDDKIYKESFIRMEYSIKTQSKGDLELEPNINIKVKLPKLEEKLSFKLTNTDDVVNKKYQDTNENTNFEDDNYSAVLVYNLFKKKVNLKFKLGAKFSSEPYLYVQTTARKDFKLNYNSNLIIKEKLNYSDVYELDNVTSLEYIYKFNSRLYFSNFNQYFVNTDERVNNIYNSLRINQKISKLKYNNYVISLNSNDENEFETIEYKTYFSHRNFVRHWLYYDLIPSITWHEDNSFEENYAFKFNLGVLIKK